MLRRKTPRASFDPALYTPVIRSSICNGEKTAGFRDNRSGQVHDVMLIRDEADLRAFRKAYAIEGEITTVY